MNPLSVNIGRSVLHQGTSVLHVNKQHAHSAHQAERRRASDLAPVAIVGLRIKKLRAALSTLGIAIGVAAIVAALGLSASSEAGLLAGIDRLGTYLLTIAPAPTFSSGNAQLPIAAPAMIGRIRPVTAMEETGATNADA
jgi:putative ABC transport system permease protein